MSDLGAFTRARSRSLGPDTRRSTYCQCYGVNLIAMGTSKTTWCYCCEHRSLVSSDMSTKEHTLVAYRTLDWRTWRWKWARCRAGRSLLCRMGRMEPSVSAWAAPKLALVGCTAACVLVVWWLRMRMCRLVAEGWDDMCACVKRSAFGSVYRSASREITLIV